MKTYKSSKRIRIINVFIGSLQSVVFNRVRHKPTALNGSSNHVQPFYQKLHFHRTCCSAFQRISRSFPRSEAGHQYAPSAMFAGAVGRSNVDMGVNPITHFFISGFVMIPVTMDSVGQYYTNSILFLFTLSFFRLKHFISICHVR